MNAFGGNGGHTGPRTVVCYICGREFGSSSIGIHEKQCAKKWEDTEAQKPPRERKPLPERPVVREGATREERNEAAKEAHEEQAMAHCVCGRTFKDEETMRRHQKSCAAAQAVSSGGRQLPPDMEAAAEQKRKEFEASVKGQGSAPSGPKTVVCYICGREFGTSSIGIHEKQCAKKWEEVEARKPTHERRALPQPPNMAVGLSREEKNEAARRAHESEVMVHCPLCGRSFKDQETMERHQRGCKGSGHRATTTKGSTSESQMDPLVGKLFSVVDADRSGIIDANEIDVALCAFGRVAEAMDFEIDYSFASMDTDHSGGVDPNEFANALQPMEEFLGRSKYCDVLKALINDAEASVQGGLIASARSNASAASRSSGLAQRERLGEHAVVPKDVSPCPNCGRNFNPESMIIHLRSCGGAHGTSKISRANLEGTTRKERDGIEAMQSLLQMPYHDSRISAKLRATFNKLDINGNGTLEREEFEVVHKMIRMPRGLKPTIDQLLSQYDANQDGKLQFAEFERMMMAFLPR